jgi:hypothetical protein
MFRPVSGIVACCLVLATAYAADKPGPDKMALLQAGEILYEYERRDESGGALRAEILIRNNAESVHAILQGCGKAFIFVDGMEQCEILERTDQYTLIRQVVDTGLLAPTLRYSCRGKPQGPGRRLGVFRCGRRRSSNLQDEGTPRFPGSTLPGPNESA